MNEIESFNIEMVRDLQLRIHRNKPRCKDYYKGTRDQMYKLDMKKHREFIRQFDEMQILYHAISCLEKTGKNQR